MLLFILIWRTINHGSPYFTAFLAGLNLLYELMWGIKGTHLWKFPKPTECELWRILNYLAINKSYLMKISCLTYIASLLIIIENVSTLQPTLLEKIRLCRYLSLRFYRNLYVSFKVCQYHLFIHNPLCCINISLSSIRTVGFVVQIYQIILCCAP